jgi:predicted flap endonuclease-1-like 5' DNA nuclease
MEQKRMAEVRHTKTGNVTMIAERVWKDWGKAKAADNEVRHDYVLVRMVTVDAKGKVIAEDPGPKATGETFIPKFIKEAAKAKDPADAPPVVPEKQPTTQPEGKRDQLAAIPSLGTKVAEALNKAGITTYKHIVEAEEEAIGKVLDAMVPPMTTKRAQVGAWKKAAGEFVKAAEQA